MWEERSPQTMGHALARKPFRLIALDLDGTLLNRRGEASAADVEALRRFVAGGGVVVLASGRMTATIRAQQRAMGLDGPVISYNGAMVRLPEGQGGEVLVHRPLPARYADELIEYARRERFALNYYLDETLYLEDDPELRRYAEMYARRTGAVYTFVPDLRAFKGREPTKALIITEPTRPGVPNPRGRDELYALWQARWGEEITIERSEPEYLEFLHPGATKGAALAALARHYGIARELVMAVGDSYNDVSMLQWAGLGVAVANATPEVKQAAAWVSPLSNEESAVAEVMARWVIM